jgi:hypothetical protein
MPPGIIFNYTTTTSISRRIEREKNRKNSLTVVQGKKKKKMKVFIFFLKLTVEKFLSFTKPFSSVFVFRRKLLERTNELTASVTDSVK